MTTERRIYVDLAGVINDRNTRRGPMSETPQDRLQALEQLREELLLGGRSAEAAALDSAIEATKQSALNELASTATAGARAMPSKTAPKTYLKLKKKYYTPAEVARRVGVSRQTIVKWIERGELEAELTPGGHHRIPASVFQREGRGDAVELIPVDES